MHSWHVDIINRILWHIFPNCFLWIWRPSVSKVNLEFFVIIKENWDKKGHYFIGISEKYNGKGIITDAVQGLFQI